MLKIDLHTHSNNSPDGGIKPQQYIEILEDNELDFIAITDHNDIKVAQDLNKSLGNRVIIGEEISTTQGEIIGLFLSNRIAPGLSLADTIKEIKNQDGIVYIPHPLETVRSGLSEEALNSISNDIDIVEVHNGRAVFQNRGPDATKWARLNHKACAASSDAHGYKGLGTTYTTINETPTRQNLVKQLQTARLITKRPPLRTLLYPKMNRIRGKIGNKR